MSDQRRDPDVTGDILRQNAGRLVLWPEVKQRIPLSRTTLWLMRQRGEFPQPVRLSPGRVAWREADLDAWIAAKIPEGR